MAKTLLMMNALTNAVTNANAEQAVAEEPDELVDAFRRLFCHLLTRDHLGALGQSSGDRRLYLRRVGALGDADVDRVEEPAGVEHFLGRGGVERREGRAGEALRVAEPDEPYELELLRAEVGDDRHGVADLEVGPLRRRGVDGDLTGAVRSGALPQRHPAQAVRAGPRDAERRRPLRRDDVAVGIDQLREARQRGLDRLDALDRRHRVDEARRNRIPGALRAAIEGLGAAHLEVDVLREVTEQAVEGVAEAVGEDERARDEGHAQQDGEPDDDEAGLAGQHAPSGDGADHEVSRRSASGDRARARPSDRPSRRRPCRRRGRSRGRSSWRRRDHASP